MNAFFKNLITALLVCVFITPLKSQTIFSYGENKVEKEEFLHAFLKNSDPGKRSSKDVMEYLQLYAVYKMKIAEAERLGYNELPHLNLDFENFKSQITPQYLVHEEYIKKNIEFSDANSRREIKLGIASFDNSPEGEKQAWRMYEEVKQGKDFQSMAIKYSNDPDVKKNKGVAGFITAFTLPYNLEKLIFSLDKGMTSSPVLTSSGWNVFANLDERPASGTITISQIFLSFPPDPSENDREQIKLRADSIYKEILNGGDFAQLATQLSDDIHSATSGGLMVPFKVGDYSEDFCEQAFALKKDGEVSEPFETSFGYHIIKRMELNPVPEKGNREYEAMLKAKILNDPERMKEARNELSDSLIEILGYKELIDRKLLIEIYKNKDTACNSKKAIVEFADGEKIFCDTWIEFAEMNSGPDMGSADNLLNEFRNYIILQHYEKELSRYNKDYSLLLKEFKEGNLLFEIMQKEVWEKAVQDTLGQFNFYNAHKSDYRWKEGADMIIFSAYDSLVAQKFMKEMLKDPSEWRFLSEITEGYIHADSGRMEFQHIPFNNVSSVNEGSFTKLLANDFDGSFSFAYIINKLPGGDLKDFESAKGFVMLDYQKSLEDAWVKDLKKRYPLKVNKKNLKKAVNSIVNF